MKKVYVRLTDSKGGTKEYHSNTVINRILSRIRLAQFKKAYVKVSYGKRLCNMNCVCEFYNDGYYTDKKEYLNAVSIFWNEI